MHAYELVYFGSCISITIQAIHYKKYSTASDVWSFGCVMYEIWSLGHKPFGEQSAIEVPVTANLKTIACTHLEWKGECTYNNYIVHELHYKHV